MSHHESHSEHSAAATEMPKKGFSFLLLAGVLLLVLLVIVGTVVVTQSGSATENEDAARAAVRTKNLAELQASDAALLNSYGWVNQAKGIVHIQISQAMELTVRALNAKPVSTPAAVTPIAAPPASAATPTPTPTQQ
jgi:flagellar basal body-associated protein FliL